VLFLPGGLVSIPARLKALAQKFRRATPPVNTPAPPQTVIVES
jgi:hypothetical protein